MTTNDGTIPAPLDRDWQSISSPVFNDDGFYWTINPAITTGGAFPTQLTREEIVRLVQETIDAYLKRPEIQKQIDDLKPRSPALLSGRRNIQI